MPPSKFKNLKKKTTKDFAKQYPYLNYWREDWGEMETTNGEWGKPRIRLIDEGRTCYEDYTTQSKDDALVKAEQYLRKVEFPARFDKETINDLEDDYKNLELKKTKYTGGGHI